MLTKLNGRNLWYDGTETVEPKYIEKRLENGISIKDVFVEEMTPDIETFNKLVPIANRIKVKKPVNISYDFNWNIPEKYKTLDIVEYVINKFNILATKEKLSKVEREIRLLRLANELELYFEYNLLNVLSVMIYVIDTFKENNIVWGVGRGSSVSSYVLYVLEVHDIDSVKWELDITDFLKPNK